MSGIMDRFVVFAQDFRPRVVDLVLPTLIDGNMEKADVSAWTVWSGATLTKSSPGYSGANCIRATITGTNQGCYQDILENTKPVRIKGWCRGTAPQRVFAGGAGAPAMWDFPISTSWQYFDVSGTTNGTRLYLVSAGGSGYVEFDDIEVTQPRSVMPNHGQAGGAPAWLTLGDGTTATTFPTPLASGYGATFDGGDYVNTGVVDRYTRKTPFSLYFFGRQTSEAASIVSCLNNPGTGFRGVAIHSTGAKGDLSFYVWAHYSDDANIYAVSGDGIMTDSASRVCVWKGTASVPSIYKDGVATAYTSTLETLSTDVINADVWYIGSARNAGALYLPFSGTIYAAGIADGLLTPADIAEVDVLVKARMA